MGLDGAVVLAVGVARAADEGADPPFAIEGDQRRLLHPLAVLARHHVAHRAGGDPFGGQVERGLHHDVLLRLADDPAGLDVHPIEEILGRRCGRGPVRHGGVSQRAGVLGGGDGAGLLHGVQHQMRPFLGFFRLVDGAVVGRALQAGGQHGGLGDGELGRRLVVEAPRRGLQPVGPAAEVDPGKVHPQDLLFGVALLQLHGQHDLLGLALHGLVGGQEQVSRQLLGDGGGALHDPALGEVLGEGARHADGVEPLVLIEAPVLDGDEGGGHIGGQAVHIHRRGVLAPAHAQDGAGAVQIGDLRLVAHLVQVRDVRQAGKRRRRDEQADQAIRSGVTTALRRPAPRRGLCRVGRRGER